MDTEEYLEQQKRLKELQKELKGKYTWGFDKIRENGEKRLQKIRDGKKMLFNNLEE